MSRKNLEKARVVSLNLHRRHLTPSQKAMVAARARDIYDREAKDRQREHGGTAPGRKTDKTLVENLPQLNEGKSRDQAGKAVGVSGRSVDFATRVLNTAEPDIDTKVDAKVLAKVDEKVDAKVA